MLGRHRSLAPIALVALLAGCESEAPTFTAPPRTDGDRTPLTRACDELDETHCLLPWPSNAFTTADATTETGIRLAVDVTQLNRRDDGAVLSRADGFSRVSTVVTGISALVDPATTASAVHLVIAQAGHPERGREIPLRVETVTAPREIDSMVVAHPLAPLEPATDYVAIVTSALRDTAGASIPTERITRVALALEPARSEDEAALAAYHAPTVALLGELGIEPGEVLRVWDFTTRSAEDPRRRLRGMREAALAAVDAGEVEVAIDVVEHRPEGAVASIVEGRLMGLPSFLDQNALSTNDLGEPVAVGTRDAPFRVMIPRGEGDYRVLMYGHGTGGSFHDANFDGAIAEIGAAKIGVEFYGWTETSVITTFANFSRVATGSSAAASGLVQAIADASAIQRAAEGVLGDALSAETLGGMPNPHAGRRPDGSMPFWVGGSLGGTMGLLFAAANPDVDHAVLNVPGAGWATWIRDALPFSYIEAGVAGANGGALHVPLAIAISQTMLDEADGASWTDVLQGEHPIVALIQESIGDPVLPNPGTEMVARVLEARMIGAPIVPIESVERASEARGITAITQYQVAETEPLDVHGFAARDTPAAEAAREQIIGFIRSAWEGEARVELPASCEGAICDFAR